MQQLSGVQQTPQSSILSTPEVLPSVGFGPDLAFTHTFPHAGLYKCWLEVQYLDALAAQRGVSASAEGKELDRRRSAAHRRRCHVPVDRFRYLGGFRLGPYQIQILAG